MEGQQGRQEDHQEEYHEKPSVYAIIDTEILFCDKLEYGARLLYAAITSLARMEGYCWATNQYLANQFKIDESTIKRWLCSLKDNEFIVIETKKNGLKWDRKIYISESKFNKSLRRFKIEPSEGSKLSLPKAQKRAHISISNKNIKGDKERSATSAPTPSPKIPPDLIERRANVHISQVDHDELVEKHGVDFVESSYDFLSQWKRGNPDQAKKHQSDFYRIARWVIKAIQKDEIEEKEMEQKKKRIATVEAKAAAQQSPSSSSGMRKQIEDYLHKNPKAMKITQVSDSGVIVRNIGEMGGAGIPFSDPDFGRRFNFELEKRIKDGSNSNGSGPKSRDLKPVDPKDLEP